jgi:hypothetical protein
LAGCSGGGGGAAAAPPPPAGSSSGWIAGLFLDADTFAAQCVAPRTGDDPATGLPYPDLPGAVVDENNWLRSWSNDLYLWYDEIVDRDPGLYTTNGYFDLLTTNAVTASGARRDKFHFSLPTDEWQLQSQSGVTASYGVDWSFVSLAPPREALVAFTEPGSPADAAGLARGARLLGVDGFDFVNDGSQSAVAVLNAALFPDAAGETHTFEVQDLGAATSREITLQSANVTSVPVPAVATIDTLSGPVGYVLFNRHIATAEQALVDAMATLDAANVVDLVLDLRYNGGGFLVIASQLAYMVAGDVPTAGRTFEEIVFNDKHPSTNPVTGTPLTPLPFANTTVGLSSAPGQQLPSLDLPRVFVLTGPDTCSASESVINSLRGVDVEVIQIGSTTCGKPYGFFPADNCGTTYFSIQFRGENAKGFGDYSDGFSPFNTAGPQGELLPGCAVADDYTQALGDPAEARLAAALAYRETQSCPTPSGLAAPGPSKTVAPLQVPEGRLLRSPWHENRILKQ